MRALYLCVGFGLIFGSVKVCSALTDFTDYALHFPTTGVSDYVDIWGMPSLTQFTACLWMKKNGTGSSNTMFCYGGAPGQSAGFVFGYNSWGSPQIIINKHALGGWPVLPFDGKWHHLCLSWENNRGFLKLYTDGTLHAQSRAFWPGEVIKSGGSFMLAARWYSRRNRFDGMLTNVNVWDHVLSPAEIEKMSKSCLSGEGNVYKWSDFIHGLKGKTRVFIPSPCKPLAS